MKKLKELFGCTDDEARGYLEVRTYVFVYTVLVRVVFCQASSLDA